jgi:hypothetical protein
MTHPSWVLGRVKVRCSARYRVHFDDFGEIAQIEGAPPAARHEARTIGDNKRGRLRDVISNYQRIWKQRLAPR